LVITTAAHSIAIRTLGVVEPAFGPRSTSTMDDITVELHD
jgi:hypothetical protein